MKRRTLKDIRECAEERAGNIKRARNEVSESMLRKKLEIEQKYAKQLESLRQNMERDIHDAWLNLHAPSPPNSALFDLLADFDEDDEDDKKDKKDKDKDDDDEKGKQKAEKKPFVFAMFFPECAEACAEAHVLRNILLKDPEEDPERTATLLSSGVAEEDLEPFVAEIKKRLATKNAKAQCYVEGELSGYKGDETKWTLDEDKPIHIKTAEFNYAMPYKEDDAAWWNQEVVSKAKFSDVDLRNYDGSDSDVQGTLQIPVFLLFKNKK